MHAGNTCFVNAAIQCLRSTPGFSLQVVPDLLDKVEARLADPGVQQRPHHRIRRSSEGAAWGSSSSGQESSAVDVHGEALARTSTDVTKEAVEAAREVLLRAASGVSITGAAATGRGSQAPPSPPAAAAAVPASPAGEAASASGGSGAGAGAAATPAAAGAEEKLGEGHLQQQQQQQEEEEAAAATAAASPVAPAGEEQPAAQESTESAGAAPQPASSPPQPPPRPPRGALLGAFAQTVEQLYLGDGKEAVDPVPLLRTLRGFPLAADYLDGGQHDCEEVLRVLMDLLHQDMVRSGGGVW